MDTKEVQVYSIPFLVHMHDFQLLKQPSSYVSYPFSPFLVRPLNFLQDNLLRRHRGLRGLGFRREANDGVEIKDGDAVRDATSL